MSNLSDSEKAEFLKCHIPHRLTLLRTVKYRQDWFRNQLLTKAKGKRGLADSEGDLFRCCKDAALISMRLLCEFLGFQSDWDENGPKGLKPKQRKKDVGVEDLLDKTIDVLNDGTLLSPKDKEVLSWILWRADKELAHFTNKSVKADKAYNEMDKMVEAIGIVERLIQALIYEGKDLPPLDKGMVFGPAFFTSEK